MSKRPENGRTPGPAARALVKSDNATTKANDTKIGHLAEAIIRLEAIEGGLARVVLGLQSVDTLPAYIELSRIARLHLKAVA